MIWLRGNQPNHWRCFGFFSFLLSFFLCFLSFLLRAIFPCALFGCSPASPLRFPKSWEWYWWFPLIVLPCFSLLLLLSHFLRLEWHRRQKTSSCVRLLGRATLRRSNHSAVTPLSMSIGKMKMDQPPCFMPAIMDTPLSWNIFSPSQRLVPTWPDTLEPLHYSLRVRKATRRWSL